MICGHNSAFANKFYLPHSFLFVAKVATFVKLWITVNSYQQSNAELEK